MTRKAKPTKPTMTQPKPFIGVDWTTSTLRPGCKDFLDVPSRQADGSTKPYGPPIYACVGLPKETANQGRD